MRSTGQSVGDFEELLQDARVAFLGHIRRMENMSRIRACHFTILHALYDRCMEKNAIRLPEHRFKEEVGNYCFLPLEAAEEIQSKDCFEDAVATELVMKSVLNALSPLDRRIMELKQSGYNGREIADILGNCSESTVSRRLTKIRQEYCRQCG